jgi:hypothetical protein
MEPQAPYSWESLPEYVAAQQYSRCLGRVFRSLPFRVRVRVVRPMTRAAVLIAQGIAGFNADVPPGELMSARERESYRTRALVGIVASREGLEALREVRRASRPDLFAALELLERIESSVRGAEVRPDWL